MNAIDPAAAGAVGLPGYAQAGRAVRLVRWLTVALLGGVLVLLAARRYGPPGQVVTVMLVSLLLPLTGTAAAWAMARARRRAASPADLVAPKRWRRLLRLAPAGDPGLIGRAARWQQAILVAALALAAVACALLPSMPRPVAPRMDLVSGACAIALTFPLLVLERVMAAMPETRLPEARDLRTLLLLPVLAWPAAGLVQVAAGLGWPLLSAIDTVLLWFLCAIAAELGLRALGRCFLPPPQPAAARAAIRSALARLIDDGIRARGLADPIRQAFGIDFSRGWALTYIRAATMPMALVLVLVCWAMTGIVLVGVDQRAVYERFGAPVAVLHPGLHAVLPWPMGQARRLEYGVIHDIALTATDILYQRTQAEDPAPRGADRLWEQAHPSELVFLIASPGSFQVVSADIRLRYRIGLSDQEAMAAVYRVAAPETFLRGAAARRVASFFANRTLDDVLGENREAMAERLRAALRNDAAATGIDLAAVVIEAIHPPAGAAEAYHNVQAAEITALTSVAAERGAALAVNAKASQYATDIVTQAQAAAAEATGAATADLTRFTADRAAALSDSGSFMFERRLGAIAQGAARSALTVIDHRISRDDAPLIDLRPFSPAARAGGTDQE